MKRRGFFGALFAGAAAPIAAAAIKSLPEELEPLPVTPAVKPKALPRSNGWDCDSFTADSYVAAKDDFSCPTPVDDGRPHRRRKGFVG